MLGTCGSPARLGCDGCDIQFWLCHPDRCAPVQHGMSQTSCDGAVPLGTQGDPFQLPLAGAQQGQGTRSDVGHIPRPSRLLCALIKGAAGLGGIQLHVTETEFLLKKEKALFCQNPQHSMHTLT